MFSGRWRRAEEIPRRVPGRPGWLVFKLTLRSDPLTGKRVQVTKRGSGRQRKPAGSALELLAKVETGQVRPRSKPLTMNELLDLYLDGMDAERRLAPKTRFDYRNHGDHFVRPALGPRKVRDLTPEAVLAWQRELLKGGGVKTGKPLAPNTVRLARRR